MKSGPVECAEIRNGFVAGRIPAGPEVDAHVADCPHCPELFAHGAALGRRLAQGAVPEVDAGELFALVDQDVKRETGLRARLRALPTSVRLAALSAIAVALTLFELVFNRREDFAAFSPLLFWLISGSLGVSVVLGVRHVLRGVIAPLGALSQERTWALSLLVLPAVALLLVPVGSGVPEAAAAWGNPLGCFVYGALLVVPFLFLFWLFERRDHVSVATLVAVGALAGVVANLLLQAHCASAHLGHLLLGHATIGAAWSLALGALRKPLGLSR